MSKFIYLKKLNITFKKKKYIEIFKSHKKINIKVSLNYFKKSKIKLFFLFKNYTNYF